MNNESNLFLMFNKNGTINTFNELTKTIIWTLCLDKPLTQRKINVKYIDFDEDNILPGEDGKLYLVNSKDEMYMLLNYTIKDLVNTSSSIVLPQFPKGIVNGKKYTETLWIDVYEGNIVSINNSNSNITYDNVIEINRIDYLLELKTHNDIVLWNITLSEIEFNSMHNKNDNINVIIDNDLYSEYDMNDILYIYYYNVTNKQISFIRSYTTHVQPLHNNNNNHIVSAFINNILNKKTYMTFIIFVISVIFTIVLCIKINNIIIIKQTAVTPPLQSLNTSSIHNNNDTKRTHHVPSLSFGEFIENKYTTAEKEQQCLRRRKLFNTYQQHNDSDSLLKANDTELNVSIINATDMNSFNEVISHSPTLSPKNHLHLKDNSFSSYEDDRECIIYKKRTFLPKVPKLSKSIFTQMKPFHPSHTQLMQFKMLNKKYQENKRISNSISLNKICQCETKQMKYIEIYKIINKPIEPTDNDKSESYNDMCNDDNIKDNYNFSLCDNGRFIMNFENIRLIDKGGFGTVFKAEHKIDGRQYAIKVIKVNIGVNDDISKIEEVKEIKMMMKVEHNNIVKYITCWFEYEDLSLFDKRTRSLSVNETTRVSTHQHTQSIFNLDNEYNDNNMYIINPNDLLDDSNNSDNLNSFNNNVSITFDGDDNTNNDINEDNDNSIHLTHLTSYTIYFYMQMEYCEGCPLSFYLQHRTHKTEEDLILNLFIQMAKALSHIHHKGIIHRDLKPANIFINGLYKVKIGDFGLAAEKKMTKDKVGTFLYQSPEQLDNKPYNEKVDIYALGLILLEMCLVFNTETERRFTLINVRKGIYPDELKQMKNECELVMKMTRNQHNDRPSIDDIINSKEIESIVDKVNRL